MNHIDFFINKLNTLYIPNEGKFSIEYFFFKKYSTSIKHTCLQR